MQYTVAGILVCGDKTIGARLIDDNKQYYDLNTQQLAAKHLTIKATNAIIDKNGRVRAKAGSLPKIQVQDKVRSNSKQNDVLVVKAEVLLDNKVLGYEVQNVKTGKINFVLKKDITNTNLGISLAKKFVGVQVTATVDAHYVLLYHGSPNKELIPCFGKGEDKHDYGKGFYLTPYAELAKEWAVCNGNTTGYLHTFLLNLQGLQVLDFDKLSELTWLAELMKHRNADNSARYKRLAPVFINKFAVDTAKYDVIYGWRADSSYFSIAKRFMRDEIDYTLISKLFHLGNLAGQFCVKSERAFKRLIRVGDAINVPADEYALKYQTRDTQARNDMMALIELADNTMKLGVTYVLGDDFTI